MQEVRGSTPLFSTFGRRAFAGRLFYFTILRISSEKILQASHLQQNALMQTNINNQPAFAVVIGASAGGLNALTELVGQLNNDMDIAVFIVLHLSNTAIGDYLVQRLQSYTSLTCKKAVNDEEILMALRACLPLKDAAESASHRIPMKQNILICRFLCLIIWKCILLFLLRRLVMLLQK